MGKQMSIPTPILKICAETGKEEARYDKVRDVLYANSMSYTKLRRLLGLGIECKGFIYKTITPLPQHIIEGLYKGSHNEEHYRPYWEERQPWEGADGFFDIAGWRNAY